MKLEMHNPASADPLTEVLHALASGAPFIQAALAQRLAVQPALVDQMLHTLQAAGYVETPASACKPDCRNCPVQDGCGMPVGARLWTITQRGRRYLRSL